MASSRLDRLAKVRPDLLDLRPGHPVRAARRLVVAPVVRLRVDPKARLRQVARLVRLPPAVPVVLRPVVPAARRLRVAPVARRLRVAPVARLRPVVLAVLAVRRSTVLATRSAARPARASCR
ncbi:MAG TPA: hypothetical protein VFR22_12530 [Nocardioidaceae bacterium]|nr:hypothetical protein [Nocardioidaceae bacterium]